MTTPREIHQTFIRTPGLELRSTWQSTQAYKRHSHAQLSIGAILEGNTRCICQDQEYLLSPGDLIVIPAHAPHSCNPLQGQPRSYHMLYIDTPLDFGQQVLRDDALFGLRDLDDRRGAVVGSAAGHADCVTAGAAPS